MTDDGNAPARVVRHYLFDRLDDGQAELLRVLLPELAVLHPLAPELVVRDAEFLEGDVVHRELVHLGEAVAMVDFEALQAGEWGGRLPRPFHRAAIERVDRLVPQPYGQPLRLVTARIAERRVCRTFGAGHRDGQSVTDDDEVHGRPRK